MNQIDTLSRKLVASIDNKYSQNVFDGKMGLCIYFFYLSRWEEKEEYKQIAEKLLDDVITNLSKSKT